MRAAASALALLLALGACGEAADEAATNNTAITEVEALPPDESVDTPTDELANGAAEPADTNAAQE